MYVPAHFAPPDDEAVRELLRHHGAADLVTNTADGLLATMLPFIYHEDDDGRRQLLGHLARNNDQWRTPAVGESLVIVRGPDAYVSPAWYPSKREHGRVVPTWNYVTAHVYGELVVHDDATWVEALVRRLTAKHEGRRAEPWAVDDMPPDFLAGQLRAIVGVELRVSRIEAKFKLSQNRPEADRAGVLAGFDTEGDASGREVASEMRATSASSS